MSTIGLIILLIVIGIFILYAFYKKSKEKAPIYYKEYTIEYLFPGKELCIEKA